MEVANTLAYYDTATITAVKSFIIQTPGLTSCQQVPNEGESAASFCHQVAALLLYLVKNHKNYNLETLLVQTQLCLAER